jgi:hypothetical protein
MRIVIFNTRDNINQNQNNKYLCDEKMIFIIIVKNVVML